VAGIFYCSRRKSPRCLLRGDAPSSTATTGVDVVMPRRCGGRRRPPVGRAAVGSRTANGSQTANRTVVGPVSASPALRRDGAVDGRGDPHPLSATQTTKTEGGGWILTVMHRGHALAGGGCAMSVSASTGDSATCYVLNVIYRYNLNVIYRTSSPLSESNILPEIERACNSVQSDSNFDEVMPAARVLPAHLVQGCAIVVIGDLF
jgi:hypothetical protein